MSASNSKTDDSKLITTDTVYVSPDGGTTDEPFPKPNVEYDFCVDVSNAGDFPSGALFVHFELSGDQDPPKDLDLAQDAGLDARASVKAPTTPNRRASPALVRVTMARLEVMPQMIAEIQQARSHGDQQLAQPWLGALEKKERAVIEFR